MSRFPDFFIVGAPKCGTTSLYEYLKPHPGIFLPASEKEPHFFASDLFNKNHNRVQAEEDYLALFAKAPPSALIGEASVFYLYSDVAIATVVDANTSAKFICMVRNPIEVAHSLHAQLLLLLEENVADFETAWRLQEDRRKGQAIPPTCSEPRLLQYRAVCSLAAQVGRFYSLVPEEQRHVVLFDDLSAEPKVVYKNVLSFLGLPDDGRTNFGRFNPCTAMRSRKFGKALHYTRNRLGAAYPLLRRCCHRLGVRPYRYLCAMNTRTVTREPLTPSFERELKSAFQDEIRALERLLDRSLTHWVDGSMGSTPGYSSTR